MCAVEWKKLGEVCTVHTGEQLNRNDMVDDGQYPVINGGKEPSGYTNSFNERANSITISQGGESAGYVNWIAEEFWAGAHCYVVEHYENVLKRFLYYSLKNIELILQSTKQGAGIPGLNRRKLYDQVIPIPSLVKQQEIVSHLDTFTTLISNLESELEMRRKQYEHYRGKLYDELLDYQVELGSFACCEKTRNKKRITENAYSITQKGLIPTKEFFKEKTKVTSNDTSNYYLVQKNWFVYSPSRIDVGSINYLRDEGPAIVSPIDVVFSIDEGVCNPNFLLNYLLSQDGMFQILKYRIGVEGTGRRSLPFSDFAKIQVPLPPPETQQSIVEKLDAFEQLIQSLETEIKLRKQQYEYYREKLLTFEK